MPCVRCAAAVDAVYDGADRNHQRLFGSASEFCLAGSEDHYRPALPLEPVHLKASISLDPDTQSIEGSVTWTLLANVPSARTIRLDAVDFQSVSIRQDDPDNAVTWYYDGRAIEIGYDAPFNVSEKRTLTIDYVVRAPLTGMNFVAPDAANPTRPRFITSDHETERCRYWLPCVDHPCVRTTLELAVRAPASYVILANGTLVDEQFVDEGRRRQATWRLTHRCPSYLLCVAAGEFVRADGGVHAGDKQIAFFAPSSIYSADDLLRSFGKTKSMLDWMTAKLDMPLPWPKYYQYAVGFGVGSAMENISLVSWDDAFVMDENLHAERGWFLDIVNVHEMAHTYFGDAVVISDFCHAWLKESWANYMELVWLQDTYGDDMMHFQMYQERELYLREVETRYARPIVTRKYDSSWQMFDMHLYPGGALRLHMLRASVIGDDQLFWRGVQRFYLKQYAGKTAETHDFRRAMELGTGMSLERFFDQWIFSAGHPIVEASLRYDSESKDLTLRLVQKQEDKARSIGLFDFDVDVAIEVADDDWAHRTVSMSSKHRSSTLVLRMANSTGRRPLQVVLDPHGKIPARIEFSPGSDMLKRSLCHSPWLLGRIHAAKTLAKSGTHTAIQALVERYSDEPFWGVRRVIAESLGTAGTLVAARGLIRLLVDHVERDARVVSAITNAAGKYRLPEMSAALTEWLSRANADERALPYGAQAAALQSLGRIMRESGVDFISSYIAPEPQPTNWWTWWIRRGAAWGLGETRSPEAARILTKQLEYGREPAGAVRVAIATAVSAALQWSKKEERYHAAEVLANVAKFDPMYPVRIAASGALARLGVSDYAEVLQVVERTVANQDVPVVRRQRNALEKAAGTCACHACAERKALEEVQCKLERLGDRVERVEELSKQDGADVKVLDGADSGVVAECGEKPDAPNNVADGANDIARP